MTQLLKAICLISLMSSMVSPLPVRAEQPVLRAPLDTTDIQSARNALDLLLSAFSASLPSEAEKLLDPQMIGYSRVMDGVRDIGIQHRQLRVSLSDVHTQAMDDVVIIQARWETRSVQVPAMTPIRRSGTCVFVMRHEGAAWKLTALSGDNPFGLD